MKRCHESGQVSAFVVLLILPLVALVGLVADGGGVLAAHQQAVSTAFEAARAGAQAIDVGELRATGAIALNQDDARTRALSYLESAGDQGTVTVSGTSVTVTVSIEHPLAVLSALGLGPVTVVGTATATATPGITGPEL